MDFLKMAALSALGVSFFSVAKAEVVSITPYTEIGIYRGFDGVLDKPVIVVEGLDLKNEISTASMFNHLPPSLRQSLSNSGRDVITVNFKRNTQSIENNADELIKVIQKVNSMKSGTHPLAVAGYSMGGLISRIALKKMENSGTPHHASVYISYDAPHRGASTSIDVFENIDDMIDEIEDFEDPVFHELPPELDLIRDKLSDLLASLRPVAVDQMLVTGGRSNAFYSYLDALGYPNSVARVAFSKGSMVGASQNLSVNEMLLSYDIEIGSSITIADHKIKARVFSGCHFPCDRLSNTFYDNAPGSKSTAINGVLDVLNRIDSVSGIGVDFDYVSSKQPTIVPTLSALDIRNFSIDTPVSSLMHRKSPFDEIYGSTYNRTHFDPTDQFGTITDTDTSIVLDVLNRHHRIGATVPSRTDKLAPLGQIENTYSNWMGQGRNRLSWDPVPGATSYQVFQGTSPYSLLASTANTYVPVNVSKSMNVLIRACASGECSPAVSEYVIYSSGPIP